MGGVRVDSCELGWGSAGRDLIVKKVIAVRDAYECVPYGW